MNRRFETSSGTVSHATPRLLNESPRANDKPSLFYESRVACASRMVHGQEAMIFQLASWLGRLKW